MGRYIYGLDPASKHDYFGIAVHELKDNMPKLRAVNQLSHTSFDRLYDYLVNNMFDRYPPYHVVIDYSNEKTFADMLIKLYGKRRIEALSFTTDAKLQLKEDGLSALKAGYKFPDPAKIKDPTVAQYINELVQQLKREQMLETKSHKTTFDHPQGQHNDLAIAWELSIHGCLKFLHLGGDASHVVGGVLGRNSHFRDYRHSGDYVDTLLAAAGTAEERSWS